MSKIDCYKFDFSFLQVGFASLGHAHYGDRGDNLTVVIPADDCHSLFQKHFRVSLDDIEQSTQTMDLYAWLMAGKQDDMGHVSGDTMKDFASVFISYALIVNIKNAVHYGGSTTEAIDRLFGMCSTIEGAVKIAARYKAVTVDDNDMDHMSGC